MTPLRARAPALVLPLAFSLVLLAAVAARSAVITVDQSGGGDFTTISEGVAASVAGDTVLVMPGTYAGPLNRDIRTDYITITAPEGPGLTTIDCDYEGYALEAWFSDVSGFTIVHCIGVLQSEFGAVFLRDGEMSDCVLEDNDCMGLVTYGGSAVTSCVFRNNANYGVRLGPEGLMARSVVSNCLFEGNARGLSVYMPASVRPSLPRWILNCTFIDNGLPVISAYYTSPVVQRCVIAGNHGSGGCIAMTASYGELRQCTIVDNECDTGTLFTFSSDVHYDSDCTISYSIIARNACSELAGGVPGDSELSNSCLFDNAWGDELPDNIATSGDIIADPLFCDLAAGDYSLCDNSPCLPYNDPVPIAMGAFPDAAGCGACTSSSVHEVSWGTIKAFYLGINER